MIGVGPYEPDKPQTSPNIARIALNVIPMADSEVGIAYRPMRNFALVPNAGTLPSVSQGAISYVNPSSGRYEIISCTSTGIYYLNADYTWTALGTGYNLPAEDSWSIIQFGDYILFSNTADGMLQYNAVTPAGITVVTGAPKARALFVAFNCVFALDCDGENRLVRNSALNNHTIWTPGRLLAGYQPMPDGQELIAGNALDDNTAVIFQRNSCSILRTTGTSQLYNMSKLAENIGCTSLRSTISSGRRFYFLSDDGFYAVDSSSGITRIGAERVNRTFFNEVDEGLLYRTQAAYDPVERQVVWFYQDSGSNAGTMSYAYCYNEPMDAWAKINPSTPLSAVYQFATPGYGLDSIDSFGTLDSLPYSLDSRFWLGGSPRLAGISYDGRVGFFDGSSPVGRVSTSAQFFERSTLINFVSPITDAGSVLIAVNAGDQISTFPTLTFQVTTTNERAYVRARGKIIQFSATLGLGVGADWTFIRGFDFVIAATGGLR